MYCLCVAMFVGDGCIVCVLQGLVVMMYCLYVTGFGGDECIVCVLQGLVVMSADLRKQ